MRIKKIKSIKNVRSFLNFTSDQEFEGKNIVYAVNGIGKTNLSRLFCWIADNEKDLDELKSREANSTPIEFIIVMDNDSEIDQSNYSSSTLDNILVFNSDFIEDNVRTDDWSNKEIDGKLELELGEEQQKLTDLLSEKEEKIEKSKAIKKELEDGLESKKTEIRSWDSRNRKTIDELAYGNLTKSKYEEHLNKKSDYQDENSKKCEGWEKAKENFDEIKDLDPDSDKISFSIKTLDSSIDYDWLKEQFENAISFEAPPTGELKEHIDKITTEWIRSGLKYHEDDKEKCPFCRLNLDDGARDVLKKYEEYVNSRKTAFEDKCDLQIKAIDQVFTSLSGINNDTKSVFELRSKNLNLDCSWEDLETTALNEFLETLKKNIQDKKDSPDKIFFTASPIDDQGLDDAPPLNFLEQAKNGLDDLNYHIKNNEQNISKINQKLVSIAQRQTTLRELLGRKYLVEFYDANKSKIEERDSLKDEISKLDHNIEELKKKLPSTDVAEKIVDLFNTFIAQIGIDKYSAELVDGKIVLKLDKKHDISADANKMVSEGEKNAIALCFFLASSIRRLNSSEKFSNGVFLIDDPICSMNYKYFYGACNVLKTFPKTIQTVLKGIESAQCPQLFLFTHNMQLFNMLGGNVFKRKAKYFELERNTPDHTIRELGAEEKLSDFKTALRRVKGYVDGKHQENIGNDIRRVLETLCRFYGYDLDPENVKKILPDIEGSLLMMAHDGSHSDVNDFEDQFDSTQYQEMSKKLLELMNENFSKVIDNLPDYV